MKSENREFNYSINGKNLKDLKVTVMGLGLHGGGSSSARFFASHGASVTVTDLRDADTLKKSIEDLSGFDIRYVLGRHDIEDFENADIVIKNPAVRPDSPYLKAAKQLETDISVFLRFNKRPVIAVTGSKGKSTTVSAINHVMKMVYPDTVLGGNITVSPLTFIDECTSESDAPVILELSSWQLSDLRGMELLKPKVSLITNIMHDHQDRYSSMDEYADDKAVIFEAQTVKEYTVFNLDCPYTERFFNGCNAAPSFFTADYSENLPENYSGAFLENDGGYFINEDGESVKILNNENTLPGKHNRLNLLAAGEVCLLFGLEPETIRIGLSEFPGIRHRLEFVRNFDNIRWYNDSAATIPEAALAAAGSFNKRVFLIAGGADKNLDFTPLAEAAAGAEAVSLLSGTADEKITSLLNSRGISYGGPFKSLEEAVEYVRKQAAGRHRQIAVLSPGCASFGMFKNEFDRGDRFRDLINSL